METFLQKPRGCRSGIKDKQSAETVDGKGTGRGASENKLTSQQHYRLLKPSSPESETEKLSAGKLRHGVPKQKESCRDEEYGTERVGRHRSGELTDGRETWMEERERETDYNGVEIWTLLLVHSFLQTPLGEYTTGISVSHDTTVNSCSVGHRFDGEISRSIFIFDGWRLILKMILV